MSKIDFPFATISYDAPIVSMVFKEGADLDVDEVRQLIAACEEVSGRKPFLLYSDARVYLDITSEARKISADRAEAPLVLANAVMVNNLVLRLFGNMFINFNKPHFPTRIFDNQEKAMSWLLAQQQAL